jgi:uncharacterized membrane protein YhaH (DUF805 family)
MTSNFFSTTGRLKRSHFWLAILVLAAVYVGLFYALTFVIPVESIDGGFEVKGAASIPFLALTLAYVVAGILIGIRRYHDMDKPGTWMLITLIPIVGPVIFLVQAGFGAGTPGPNRFGTDPRATA